MINSLLGTRMAWLMPASYLDIIRCKTETAGFFCFLFSHWISTTESLKISHWFILFKQIYNVCSKCHALSFSVFWSQELLAEFTSKLGHSVARSLAGSPREKNPSCDKIITGLEALPVQAPSFVILVLRGWAKCLCCLEPACFANRHILF